jgi:hypothetical protein
MSASIWGSPRKLVVDNFPLSILGWHRPEIAMDKLRPNAGTGGIEFNARKRTLKPSDKFEAMKKIVTVFPVLFTVFLLVWWVLIEKYSYYGSWYVNPALAILPLVLLWHVGVMIWKSQRTPMVMFALIHLVFFIPIWFYCVMSLSRDSL